jgi:hypothetical protein
VFYDIEQTFTWETRVSLGDLWAISYASFMPRLTVFIFILVQEHQHSVRQGTRLFAKKDGRQLKYNDPGKLAIIGIKNTPNDFSSRKGLVLY